MLDILDIIGPPGAPLFVDWEAPNIGVIGVWRFADWIVERINQERLVMNEEICEKASVMTCWELSDSALFVVTERETFGVNTSNVEEADCLENFYQGLLIEVVRRQLVIRHLFSVSSKDAIDRLPPSYQISNYRFDCRCNGRIVGVDLVLNLIFGWRRTAPPVPKKSIERFVPLGTHGILLRRNGSGPDARFLAESFLG
ncbi:MAG: hypothetical protein V4664_02825 [Patescibacteria group bacterium]